MLRGGSALNQQGGELLSTQAPQVGSILPDGAQVDLHAVGSVDKSGGYGYNSTVAEKRLLEVLPTNGHASSTLSYTLEPNMTPGLMYDFKNSFVELHFTGTLSGADAGEHNAPYPLFGLMCFDTVRAYCQGIEISHVQSGIAPWQAWHKALISERGYDSTAISDNDVSQSDPVHLNLSNELIEWGSMVIQSSINPSGNTAAIRGYLDLVNRVFIVKVPLRLLNPIFETPYYHPSGLRYRFDLHKAINDFSFMVRNSPSNKDFDLTLDSASFWVEQVQLSAAGQQMYQSLVSKVGGMLTYPCSHVETNQYAIASGSSSIKQTILGKAPQCMIISFHPSDHLLYSTNAGTDNYPFSCRNSGGTIAPVRLQSLYVRINGQRVYDWDIVRSTTAPNTQGGSSMREFDQYKTLAKKNGVDSEKTFFRLHNMTDGNFLVTFINCQGNQEQFEGRKPPHIPTGTIEIIAQLQSATVTENTMVVTSISNSAYFVEPASGRVKTGW